ncbi:MAG: Holliday junction branch migration protein RuvA [Longimicrobiaceae bacterium]
MISRLKGVLVLSEPDRVELMTSAGVGYEVQVPLGVYEQLPRPGREVELLVRQVVREDSVALFGFLEPVERTLFERLLTASGVGPRLALTILSSLSPGRLARAVRDRDAAALTTVNGVGKKTAERLILELADKLDDLPPGAEGERDRGAGDAVRALEVLGFLPADAERAVREVLREEGELASTELVKAAVGRLR